MSSDLKELLEEMKRGIKDAGFVNVRGVVFTDGPFPQLRVKADCPCGLGTSGFDYMVNEDLRIDLRIEKVIIYRRFHHMALRHIEVDRAEGRWVD